MDDEATAEQRLEKFALSMQESDATLIPRAYQGDDAGSFISDVRSVLARLKAAESSYRGV